MHLTSCHIQKKAEASVDERIKTKKKKKKNPNISRIRTNILLDEFKIILKTDRDKISVINNKETKGNVPSVIVPSG